MRSIYQQVLGPEFDRLHSRIQERFGFTSAQGIASIGRGVMHRIWHGSPLVVPFLCIGTWRHIMFPEQGCEVPFEVANYAFRDHHGREVISWVRTFWFPGRTRRFDAYMTLPHDGRCIVDYFGTHAHYATDLHLSVAPNGGLAIESGAHRFHLAGARLPFPEALSGKARVVERFDDDLGRYRPRHILPVRALPA